MKSQVGTVVDDLIIMSFLVTKLIPPKGDYGGFANVDVGGVHHYMILYSHPGECWIKFVRTSSSDYSDLFLIVAL